MLRKRSPLIQHYSDVDCGPEKNCKNSWNHLTMRHDSSQCSGGSGGKSFCSAYIFVDLRQWSGNVDVVKIMNETRDTIPRTCSSTSHIIIPCPPSSSKFLLVSGSAASSPPPNKCQYWAHQPWGNTEIIFKHQIVFIRDGELFERWVRSSTKHLRVDVRRTRVWGVHGWVPRVTGGGGCSTRALPRAWTRAGHAASLRWSDRKHDLTLVDDRHWTRDLIF